METFKTITEHLLPPVLIIVAGVLTMLGRYLMKWLAHKLRAEQFYEQQAVEAAVDRVVSSAVSYAEQMALSWARDKQELATGPRKLDWALGYIRREMMEQRLPEMARDRMVDLIEARLGSPEAPGEAVRAQDAMMKLRSSAITGAVLCLFLAACGGATSIERATRAYGSVRAVHTRAVQTLRTVISEDLRDHCSEAADPSGCVQERAARWSATQSAVNAAAASLDVSADALLLWAERNQPNDVPAELCPVIAESVEAVRAYMTMLDDLGHGLPLPGTAVWECE